MTTTSSALTVRPISTIPASASVCHFDEVDERVQSAVISASRSHPSAVTVDEPVADRIADRDCDVIKFVKYYGIEQE